MNSEKSTVSPASKSSGIQIQAAQQIQSQRGVTSKKSSKGGVEHQFLNKMPEVNSVENDLMKLLNEFSNTRLKKYGLFSLYLT